MISARDVTQTTVHTSSLLILHSRMKAATTLTYNSPYDMKRRRKIFSGFIFPAFSTASSFYILFAFSMVLQAISSCFKAKLCWHFISGRSVMSFLFSHVLLLFTCGTHTGATPYQFPIRRLVEFHVDASFLAGFSRAHC